MTSATSPPGSSSPSSPSFAMRSVIRCGDLAKRELRPTTAGPSLVQVIESSSSGSFVSSSSPRSMKPSESLVLPPVGKYALLSALVTCASA